MISLRFQFILASLICSCALPAAAVVVVVPPNGASVVNSTQKPARTSQFLETQRKAIESAGSSVGDDFILRWFGPEALHDLRSPILEAADDKGLYSIEFIKEGGAWKKSTTRADQQNLSNQQRLSNLNSSAETGGATRANQNSRVIPGVTIVRPGNPTR